MNFAFDRAQHDRVASLRKGDWRDPKAKVMVLGGEHIATVSGASIRWLNLDEAPEAELALLTVRDGQTYLAAMVDRVPDDLEPLSLRAIGTTLDEFETSLCVHAVGLARWHDTHGRCARCGEPTVVQQAGHIRHCPSCGADHFPRTDPAVIMLVTDDQDRALLGRQVSWPEGRFSTLAGFVEPGETLEDAVRREVDEEAGIRVDEVAYGASQPWPFPSSLMVGFFAVAQSTDVRVDGEEIAEAAWFSREEITEKTAANELILPGSVSISRWLIDQWHGGEITGRWT